MSKYFILFFKKWSSTCEEDSLTSFIFEGSLNWIFENSIFKKVEHVDRGTDWTKKFLVRSYLTFGNYKVEIILKRAGTYSLF